MGRRTLILRTGDREYRAATDDSGGVSIDGGEPLPVRPIGAGEVRVGPGGGCRVHVAAAGAVQWVFVDGEVYEIEIRDARRARRAAPAHATLSAPMPATVVRVEVEPGQAVRKGDTLVILEAMKMELPVRAPADGVVQTVSCRAGDLVKPGVPLVEMA